MTLDEVFTQIQVERAYQTALREQGKFDYTCDMESMSNHQFLSVLTEEVGEIAKALNDGDMKNFAYEILQVAAVCAARLELIGL